MSIVKIAYNAVKAKLLTDDPVVKGIILNNLTYEVKGAEHTAAYKSGWNGSSTFFSYSTNTFPAGFVLSVKSTLKRLGYTVQLIHQDLPKPLFEGIPKVDEFPEEERYSYQFETVERLLKYGKMIAQISTGGGKCLQKDTNVLMYNGEIKKVQDIQINDLLMGPDSLPKKVLGTTNGFSKLYKITPTKGESYVVNDAHILSLKNTTINKKEKGNIININVEDYINKNKTFKHCHKGWRTGVEFNNNEKLSIDPYFIGILAGDGTVSHTVSVCTMDNEIVEFLKEQAELFNLKITTVGKINNKSSSYYLSGGLGCKENLLMRELRKLGLEVTGEDKFIPQIYKTANRENRLKLLAGIIDTDGYYDGKCLYLTLKSEKLLDDVVFVARSLGFAAYKKKVNKTCYNNGKIGTYYATVISGNLEEIPLRVKRRIPNHRKQKKDVLVTGIKVERVEDGEYFGFEIDGDGLFLLGDFTVTHNTKVAKLAVKKIGRKSLFITTRSLLMYQMKRQLEKMGYDVGVIGDGIYNPKPLVNVAMVQTLGSALTVRTVEEEVLRVQELEKKKIQKLLDTKKAELYSLWHKEKITQKELDIQYRSYQQSLDRKTRDDIRKKAIDSCKEMNLSYKKTKEFLETIEFVIAEEAHESSGNEYYNIMQHCINAHYRLALTATPFMRGDEAADMKLMACSGHIGIKVSEKQLIDCGILATPYFKFIPMTAVAGLYPSTPWARAYEIGIVKNAIRNNLILKESIVSKEHKVPNLILVQRQDHGKNLCKLLKDADIKCDFIFGETDKAIREQKLKELSDGVIDTLIGSTILDVGVDVPAIGKIILAGGGKAEVALRQRIGRGLRAKKKGNYTFIVDFMDCGNKHISEHYKTRREIIENTPGFGENILNINEDFNYSLLEK